MMARQLELSLIYADAFKEKNYPYFKSNIVLSTSSWMNDLEVTKLIDDNCREEITYELNDREKIIKLASYLVRQNDIRKYKLFINIWKKHDPAIAKQFEGSLRQRIRDRGLLDVDDEYQIRSEGASVIPAQFIGEDSQLANINLNLKQNPPDSYISASEQTLFDGKKQIQLGGFNLTPPSGPVQIPSGDYEQSSPGGLAPTKFNDKYRHNSIIGLGQIPPGSLILIPSGGFESNLSGSVRIMHQVGFGPIPPCGHIQIPESSFVSNSSGSSCGQIPPGSYIQYAQSGQILSHDYEFVSHSSYDQSQPDSYRKIPSRDYENLDDPQRWEKRHKLGGCFSQVFLYHHINTGEKVAVKEVKFDPSVPKKTLESMLQLKEEVANLKMLSHERIVRYLGSFSNNETFILSVSLEYMPGRSLYDCLQTVGRFTENQTKKYTRQVLEGVAFLHSLKRPIVHRQIKGANILKDDKDNVKLADFGMAKQLEWSRGANTQHEDLYCWSAPEIVCDEPYGVEVDIWSVGCTVVEMLTTEPPWYLKEPNKTILALNSKKYPVYKLPQLTSNEAEDFLKRCFIINPRDRPSAVQLLNDMPFCRHMTS